MKDKVYEEVGTNYRFFARWRHLALAGDLLVVWAILSLCVIAYKDARELMWLIPLIASPIGVVLWIIDYRTRDMYHAAIRAGADLEGDLKGFYTRVRDEVALPKDKSFINRLTHTLALSIVFFGTTAILLLLSVWCFVKFA